MALLISDAQTAPIGGCERRAAESSSLTRQDRTDMSDGARTLRTLPHNSQRPARAAPPPSSQLLVPGTHTAPGSQVLLLEAVSAPGLEGLLLTTASAPGSQVLMHAPL